MIRYLRLTVMLLLVAAMILASTPGGRLLVANATDLPEIVMPEVDVVTSGPDPQPLLSPRAMREDQDFADLTTGHWAFEDIMKLNDLGLMSGNEDGFIFPDRPVSRAELAKLLVAAGNYEPGSGPAIPTFTDVQPGDWFYPHVEMAYRLALMQGYGSRFQPYDQVTREELATMAVRARAWETLARNTTYSAAVAALPYSDRGDISPSIRNHVAVAVQQGLIDGFADGTFQPHAPVTRADVAALVAQNLLLEPVGHEIEFEGHTFRYLEEYDMMATAYGAGEPWLSDVTFLGLRVREGIVAVDPTVIPLGSHLYVEGYGFAVAADTGRLIKGDKIDLYYEHDARFVLHFGIQPRRVFLLDSP